MGWWRWPLVPLAAVLGALAGSLALFFVLWLSMKMRGDFNENGWLYLYIIPLMQAATFGYLYTWISCAVAPRGKFITGVVMVTTLLALHAVALIFVWQRSPDTGAAIQVTVSGIAIGIACIVGLIHAHEEHE